MANYDFYNSGTSTAVSGIETPNEATPGDTSTLKIRRGRVDSTKQTLNAADVARVFPIYAGEIVLGVFIKVDTAESTSDAAVDVGVDGGGEFGTDVLVTTANAVAGNWEAPQFVSANGNLTLVPNNSVAVDTGIINVAAVITKDFDNL
jgi:hypothetical protein